MPKLRNSTTDVGAFTEYLARKCVIHKPQAELDVVAKDRAAKPNIYNEKSNAEVHLMIDPSARDAEPNTFVAISPKGRAMKVTVEEVDPATLYKGNFKKVGT